MRCFEERVSRYACDAFSSLRRGHACGADGGREQPDRCEESEACLSSGAPPFYTGQSVGLSKQLVPANNAGLRAWAGITVLWAIAASLVPQMQKGDSAARRCGWGWGMRRRRGGREASAAVGRAPNPPPVY